MNDTTVAEKIGELAGRVVALAAQQAAQHLENQRAMLDGFGRADRRFEAMQRDMSEFRRDVDGRLIHLEKWHTSMLAIWGAIVFILTIVATGGWERLIMLLRGK